MMKLLIQVRYYLFLLLLIPVATGVFSVTASAQDNANTEAAATPTPAPPPSPVPISEVVTQSESTSATLKELAASAASNPAVETVERELPLVTGQIDARLEETAKIVDGPLSFERLRSIESDWGSTSRKLTNWNRELAGFAKSLESDIKTLDGLGQKWSMTLEELREVESTPQVVARVEETLASINSIRKQIESAQSRVVGLQSKVAEQQKRVDEAVASIIETRESLVGQLFVQDSPPVWAGDFWSRARSATSASVNETFAVQTEAIAAFVQLNTARFVFHLLLFALSDNPRRGKRS
jgi:small-conductance mechanosensitive channel